MELIGKHPGINITSYKFTVKDAKDALNQYEAEIKLQDSSYRGLSKEQIEVNAELLFAMLHNKEFIKSVQSNLKTDDLEIASANIKAVFEAIGANKFLTDNVQYAITESFTYEDPTQYKVFLSTMIVIWLISKKSGFAFSAGQIMAGLYKMMQNTSYDKQQFSKSLRNSWENNEDSGVLVQITEVTKTFAHKMVRDPMIKASEGLKYLWKNKNEAVEFLNPYHARFMWNFKSLFLNQFDPMYNLNAIMPFTSLDNRMITDNKILKILDSYLADMSRDDFFALSHYYDTKSRYFTASIYEILFNDLNKFVKVSPKITQTNIHDIIDDKSAFTMSNKIAQILDNKDYKIKYIADLTVIQLAEKIKEKPAYAYAALKQNSFVFLGNFYEIHKVKLKLTDIGDEEAIVLAKNLLLRAKINSKQIKQETTPYLRENTLLDSVVTYSSNNDDKKADDDNTYSFNKYEKIKESLLSPILGENKGGFTFQYDGLGKIVISDNALTDNDEYNFIGVEKDETIKVPAIYESAKLFGGMGNDTYSFSYLTKNVFISDRDHKGRIIVQGKPLNVNYYTYKMSRNNLILINSANNQKIEIENFRSGDFGIKLLDIKKTEQTSGLTQVAKTSSIVDKQVLPTKEKKQNNNKRNFILKVLENMQDGKIVIKTEQRYNLNITKNYAIMNVPTGKGWEIEASKMLLQKQLKITRKNFKQTYKEIGSYDNLLLNIARVIKELNNTNGGKETFIPLLYYTNNNQRQTAKTTIPTLKKSA